MKLTHRWVLWQTLTVGGYNGDIDGWTCESKGELDPFAEKCVRESQVDGGQEVTKTSRPENCPTCMANKK